MRDVCQEQPPGAISGLQLLRALLEIVRHLIERTGERRHFIAAILPSARRQIAGAYLARGILEAAQPRTHRTEDQQRRGGCADDDEHRADNPERRAELPQRRARHRNHEAHGHAIDDDGPCGPARRGGG